MAASPDIESLEPSKSIGHLINRLRGEIFLAFDREFETDPSVAALEVTAAQYVILVNLAKRELDSTASLCKLLSYDPGAMTRMLDRLESKSLVRRGRSPDDRRLVNIELTEEGRAAVPKLRACAVNVLNRFVRGFSPEEVLVLRGLLERMLANA